MAEREVGDAGRDLWQMSHGWSVKEAVRGRNMEANTKKAHLNKPMIQKYIYSKI